MIHVCLRITRHRPVIHVPIKVSAFTAWKHRRPQAVTNLQQPQCHPLRITTIIPSTKIEIISLDHQSERERKLCMSARMARFSRINQYQVLRCYKWRPGPLCRPVDNHRLRLFRRQCQHRLRQRQRQRPINIFTKNIYEKSTTRL